MSLADELLATVSAYPVDDSTEEHIVINQNRFITVPSSLKRIAVQYDNNVETVTFDCPRYWDKCDMSKMKVYINYIRADHQPDSYPVDTGVTVDENDPSIMHFDWTISSNVTEVHGKIVFLVCIKSVDENGDEHEHWNSELCTDMYVSEGLETQQRVAEKYPDLITHLLTRMDVVENKTTLESMLGYLDTYFTTDAEINKVLKDYVDVYLRTDDSVTKKIADTVNAYIAEHLSATDKTLTVSEMPADAAATGEAIKNTINITNEANISDSVDGVLKIKKLYGRSEQKTIPGNQLLDIPDGEVAINGTLKSITQSGVVHVSGTPTQDTLFAIKGSYNNTSPLFTLPIGTYTAHSQLYFHSYDGTNRKVLSNTFTVTEETPITCVFVKNTENTFRAGTSYDFTIYPMLNAGSTALPWEPYCGGIPSPNPDYPQEIKSVVVDKVKVRNHENLITEISKGYIAAGVSYAPTDNETYKNAKYTNLFEANLGDKLYFADNTYAVAYRIRFYDSNLAYLGTSGGSDVDFVPVITKGVKYAAFMDLQGRIGDGFVLSKTPMSEWRENTVTLSQPITLRGIGDVMDELTPDGVVRKFRTIRLSADWVWSKHGGDTPSPENAYYAFQSIGQKQVSDGRNGIFTHFRLGSTAKADCAFVGSNNIQLRNDAITSVSALKEWLAEEEVYCAYELDEPITEPLPVVDAKALKTALRSYNGATYVTTDSPVTPGFELEYPRTLAASYILEDQKNVAELMTPIREVSGVGDLTIDDSVAGGLRVTKMVGKSVQETLSGKNLFDVNALNLNTNTSLDIYDDGYTVVAKGGTKGGYTDSVYLLELDNLLGKTVYLMADSITGGEAVHLVVTNANGTITYNAINEQTLSKAVIIPTDATRIQGRILTNNTSTALGTDETLTIKGLRLCFDADAEWEPYCGGIPSPNPEYPQEIKSVVVDEVKVFAENLFDSSYRASDGKVRAWNGTATEANGVFTCTARTKDMFVWQVREKDAPYYEEYGQIIEIPNGVVTFDVILSNPAFVKNFITFFDSNKVSLGYEEYGSNRFTVSTDYYPAAKYFTLRFGTGDLINSGTYETTVIISQDFNSAILSQPITLKAIPVTEASLANYTDPDGQMWCADTIEEVDGKMCLVERVGKNITNSVNVSNITSISDNLKWGFAKTVPDSSLNGMKSRAHLYVMCDKFTLVAQGDEGSESTGTCISAYGHVDSLEFRFRLLQSEYPTKEDAVNAIVGTTCYYPLATPIITELTNDEIIALRSLKSYHGITHIFTENNPTGELTVSYGATELGGLALENKNLHEVNEALDNKLEEKVEENGVLIQENKDLITAINSALPFEIIIDDAAGTINFVDRQVGD